MKRKPWPILIIAFFHLIEPFTKSLFYGTYFDKNLYDFMEFTWAMSTNFERFRYFFLFPLAGLCIFIVRKWGLYLFLAVEVWILIVNSTQFHLLYENGHYFVLFSIIFFILLNISVVSYFLIPSIWMAYHDPKMRWWETSRRYSLRIPCMISYFLESKDNLSDISQEQNVEVFLVNLSRTGAYVSMREKITLPGYVNIQFSFYNFSFSLNAQVVHNLNLGGREGFGLRFIGLTCRERSDLRRLTKFLDVLGIIRYPAKGQP